MVSQWSTADRPPLSDVIPVCRGELAHAIHAEHARSVTAVLARRSRLATIDLKAAEELVPVMNELLDQHPEGSGGQSLNLAH